MTLNGVTALILHYFTEFDSSGGRLRHSGWKQTYNVGRISSSTFGQICPRSSCDNWATWPKTAPANMAFEPRTTAGKKYFYLQFNHCVLFGLVSGRQRISQLCKWIDLAMHQTNTHSADVIHSHHALIIAQNQCPPRLSPPRYTLSYSIHSTMALAVPTTVFHYTDNR